MQGENLIHGLACRLEERMAKGGGGPMSDLFGVLHTLADTGSESFKVGTSWVGPRRLPSPAVKGNGCLWQTEASILVRVRGASMVHPSFDDVLACCPVHVSLHVYAIPA
jgi:hypothetical protein